MGDLVIEGIALANHNIQRETITYIGYGGCGCLKVLHDGFMAGVITNATPRQPKKLYGYWAPYEIRWWGYRFHK